jgi:hypothetical protein
MFTKINLWFFKIKLAIGLKPFQYTASHLNIAYEKYNYQISGSQAWNTFRA